jgi:hypothetical protein
MNMKKLEQLKSDVLIETVAYCMLTCVEVWSGILSAGLAVSNGESSCYVTTRLVTWTYQWRSCFRQTSFKNWTGTKTRELLQICRRVITDKPTDQTARGERTLDSGRQPRQSSILVTHACSANWKLSKSNLQKNTADSCTDGRMDGQIGSCPAGGEWRVRWKPFYADTQRCEGSHPRKEGNTMRGRKHETRCPSPSSAVPLSYTLSSLYFHLTREYTDVVLWGVTSGYPHSKPSADAVVTVVRQKSLSAPAHNNSTSGNRSTSHDVTVESNPSRGRDRKIQY